jgi:predicted HTH transcriptional regulator
MRQRSGGIQKEETLEDYLAHGEDATVEFKSTCRWDLNTEQVNAALQKVIAKSIAGFLNTQGGVLLIGVSDDGSIIGIENDINSLKRRDRDGFQQALTQSITNYLGAEFCRNIQISFAERDKKTVCIVKVESSPRPVFLEDRGEKEFYIRFGNTTRPLDIEEANKYIGTHW